LNRRLTSKYLVLVFLFLVSIDSSAEESICYGKVNSGRLENGVQLPDHGKNYSAYSELGVSSGRTYVHSKIRDVVVKTYKELESIEPDKVYVYGETGWKDGGRIRPHRTHQNGLSIDFMVPVVDKAGHSIKLPTSILNKYGYGIDFDEEGQSGDLQIDFEAMASHLMTLAQIAKQENVEISLVIFDGSLKPALFKSKNGASLQDMLPWMKGKAWIKHDQHYHIDFSVPCRPMTVKN